MSNLDNSQVKILLVDDTPENLEVAGSILSTQDYDLYISDSGFNALELVRENGFDLILLDIMMPEMDGFETFKRIKSLTRNKDIPVIFLTGIADIDNVIRGFEMGAVDYIKKPFNPLELLARVKSQIDLKRMRKQIADAHIARKAAEDANRAKSAFLSHMSHEIRTPLNAIIGFAQILNRDSSLTPNQSEKTQSILRSGEHLLELINNVLNLSRIEEGSSTINQVDFNLHGMLEELQRMFEPQAKRKSIPFAISWSDDVPEAIKADEAKLRQVFINLIGNALKFTEQGFVRVKVDTQASAADAGVSSGLNVEVADTGPGISKADQLRIFDSFYQAEETCSTGGSGLGLTISRNLIEMMGGSIALESEPGKGSLFRFSLPLVPSNKDLGREEAFADDILGIAADTGPHRILIVDDNKDNHKMLQEMLRSVGFQVKSAENGQEALDVLKDYDAHAVLMDLRMPVMDGYEATRIFKATEKGKNTLVLAVTACTYDMERDRIYETGADAILCKPFRSKDIFKLLAKIPRLRYVRKESSPRDDHQTGEIPTTKAELAALDRSLLEEMRKAVEQGNMVHLRSLISNVKSFNELAAQELHALAKAYDYEKLEKLLKCL